MTIIEMDLSGIHGELSEEMPDNTGEIILPEDVLPDEEIFLDETEADPTPEVLEEIEIEPDAVLFSFTVPEQRLIGEDQLDSLKLYFRDISQYRLLTFEEEQQLGEDIAKGTWAEMELARLANGTEERDDQSQEQREGLLYAVTRKNAAKDQLVQCNQKLVVSVVKRYLGYGHPMLDLIQEGNIGLMKAVKKFDHTLGYKFSTYATWWIRQSVSRFCDDQQSLIRIPVGLGSLIRRYSKLHQKTDLILSDSELADVLHLSLRQIEEMRINGATKDDFLAAALGITPHRLMTVRDTKRTKQDLLSLDASPTDTGSPLGDVIASKAQTKGSMDVTEVYRLGEHLEEVFQSLSERERYVLEQRFGLTGNELTLEELGKQLDITRERVRQIETKALRKLRNPKRSRSLRDYLG